HECFLPGSWVFDGSHKAIGRPLPFCDSPPAPVTARRGRHQTVMGDNYRREMSEHLSKQFDADLEAIRSRVLEMGGLVESQIRRALDALASGDRALADE